MSHPAEPGAQEAQLPAGALELVRVRVAADQDRRPLRHPRIALPQRDAGLLRKRHQLDQRPMREAGVVCHRLWLHGGVDRHPLKVLVLDRSAPVHHRKALLQQRHQPLFAHPLRQRVMDKRSKGSACRKLCSPQKNWKYGFSSQRAHNASSDSECMCLRIASPAISRVGSGGWPAPGRYTAPKRRSRKPQSIRAANHTSGCSRSMIASNAGLNRSF